MGRFQIRAASVHAHRPDPPPLLSPRHQHPSGKEPKPATSPSALTSTRGGRGQRSIRCMEWWVIGGGGCPPSVCVCMCMLVCVVVCPVHSRRADCLRPFSCRIRQALVPSPTSVRQYLRQRSLMHCLPLPISPSPLVLRNEWKTTSASQSPRR